MNSRPSTSTAIRYDIANWGTLPVPEPPAAGATLCLVNTAEHFTTLPGIDHLPANYTAIVCDASCSTIKVISDSFLKGLSHLKTVDLTCLGGAVTCIGDEFLAGCCALRNVDLAPLKAVISIGTSFLEGCCSLSVVDLSPLSGMSSIESGFLAKCSALRSVNLSPLSGVTSIDDSFLEDCSSLAVVDLNLSSLISIGSGFLAGCSTLRSVGLGPLCGVTFVGSGFLANCSALRSVDLTSLSSLTSVSTGFLAKCCALRSLDLSPLHGVTSIGNSFLEDCSSLETVDLSPLSNVTSLGNGFLAKCSALRSLDLRPLRSVTSIGSSFARDCVALDSINLEPLRNVAKIGNSFLSGCKYDVKGDIDIFSLPIEEQLTTAAHSLQDLTPVADLGGSVSLFFDPRTGQSVAVKSVHRALREEYTKLLKMEHPNVVHVVQYVEDAVLPHSNKVHDCILMEHMELGATSSLVSRRHNITLAFPSLDQWKDIAKQTLAGLEALHQCNIVHRNLKPQNILMGVAGGQIVYKIADIGLGIEPEEGLSSTTTMLSGCETRGYVAPECVENNTFSRASDVYSWACTMGYIATGKLPRPYHPHRLAEARGFLVKELMTEGTKLPVHVAELLVRCFSFDRKTRPKTEELLQTFFKEVERW